MPIKKKAVPPTMVLPHCGTCSFWMPEPAKLPKDHGWCKRNPKQVIEVMDDGEVRSSHPVEHRMEPACGEYNCPKG